jgi:hypothetical protein
MRRSHFHRNRTGAQSGHPLEVQDKGATYMQQDPEAASAAGAARTGQDLYVRADADGWFSRPGLLADRSSADLQRLTLSR